MFDMFFVNLVTRSPGVIVGPVAKVLGMLYNVFFNLIYGVIQTSSLGIAIIIFTLVIKTILFPLTYKQMKSTYSMQKLQPQLNKIKEKYERKKDDPTSQQKMAMEMQKLQKDSGVSMFGGCLPLLIQLPILYALFYIFQQAYLYVDVIAANYQSITDVILQIPAQLRVDVFKDIAVAHKMNMDLALSSDVIKLVNEITKSEWQTILAGVGSYSDQLMPLLTAKTNIEGFLGIDLVYRAGISWPGILIPLASAGTTYLSSKIMMKNSSSSSDPNDPTAKTMKTMNLMMPIMMGGMCITMPAGLGLYWIISNLVQMAQSAILNKYFKAKEEKESKGVL